MSAWHSVEAESAAHRHVADIGDLQSPHRGDPQHMLVRADPLDRANGARPEASAGPVGHAEVHRHADQRDVEPGKAGGGRLGPSGAPMKVAGPANGHLRLSALGRPASDRGEMRVVDIAALGLGVPFAQRSEHCLTTSNPHRPEGRCHLAGPKQLCSVLARSILHVRWQAATLSRVADSTELV